MVEGKVVLVMIMRRFAFEKIGLTGRNGEEEAHKSMAVASVLCDRVRVRVKKVGLKKVCSLGTGFWVSCLRSYLSIRKSTLRPFSEDHALLYSSI